MNGATVRDGARGAVPPFRRPTPGSAARGTGSVARLFADVKREFGATVAVIAAHAPAPGSLAACWAMLRAILVADGFVDRTTKEAVAVAVSLANGCDAGVALHLAVLERLNAAHAAATPDDEVAGHEHHRVRAITEWARAATGSPAALGVPADQVPELVGVVLLTHYLNRMATVLVPDGRPGGAVHRVARLATRSHEPGAADGLPVAPLQIDLGWATANPGVAGALIHATAVVDGVGARLLPPPLRALVLDELAIRPEADPSRLAARLSTMDCPVGRLTLLTALAPHRVDDALVRRCRLVCGDDRALVEVVQWASLAAARVIAGRAAARVWTLDDRRRTPPDAGGRVCVLRPA